MVEGAWDILRGSHLEIHVLMNRCLEYEAASAHWPPHAQEVGCYFMPP